MLNNEITKEELLKLYDLKLEDLIKISEKITKENFKNDDIELCSIISAKTGNCRENCKYCAQSATSKAKIKTHPLLEVEDVKKVAQKAKENGATRFCIVTSGKTVDDSEFEIILQMIKEVSKIDGLNCCASLGILIKEQIKQIKKAGVKRFNHNINTSRENYKNICSTHDFKDRINTLKLLKKEDIELCSGVILGMGENREDRVEMILSLKKLNPKTVPINILNPIEGTEFENYKKLIDEDEILKTICLFRITLPKAILRYAGGRDVNLSRVNQILGLKAGINGLLIGDYLTTKALSPLFHFK